MRARARQVVFTVACLTAGAGLADFACAQTPESGMKIISPKSGVGTKFVIEATKQVVKVNTSATVPAGTQTQVAGFALVNESTCTFDGTGKWTVKKPPANGTITTGTVTGPLGDGKCPGDTFTFATISYTSTSATAKTDKLLADWNQVYQGVNYITVDKFRIKIAH